jgi:hypothetical protein
MLATGNLSLTRRSLQYGPRSSPFATSTAEIAALHCEPSMQFVRAMREEVNTAWRRLEPDRVHRGRLRAWRDRVSRRNDPHERAGAVVRPTARGGAGSVDVQAPTAATAPEAAPKPVSKSKPLNEHFQAIDLCLVPTSTKRRSPAAARMLSNDCRRSALPKCARSGRPLNAIPKRSAAIISPPESRAGR